MSKDNELFPNIDNDLDVEQIDLMIDKDRWPATTKEIFDILQLKLKSLELDPQMALPILVELSKQFGGLQIYFPRAKTLEVYLRDIQIWEQFNGKNVPELVRKFGVTHETVYKAISRMRAIEKKKRQPELF